MYFQLCLQFDKAELTLISDIFFSLLILSIPRIMTLDVKRREIRAAELNKRVCKSGVKKNLSTFYKFSEEI